MKPHLTFVEPGGSSQRQATIWYRLWRIESTCLLPTGAGISYGTFQVEDMSRILIENGFSYGGKDMLTSGITGEPLQAYVYFGPIYYQVSTIAALGDYAMS